MFQAEVSSGPPGLALTVFLSYLGSAFPGLHCSADSSSV